MKIAVFADIHSSMEMLEKTAKSAFEKQKGTELVLLLGDNTHYGGISDIKKILQIIGNKKILALPGNLDLKEVSGIFEERGISLHSKKAKIEGFTFIGFGGAILGNPGETNFSEEKIYSTLKKLCAGEKNIVLCTHLPPLGTKIDFASRGVHIGSSAVRKIIEEFRPLLHLCAHCHEAFGEEKIGKTLCINSGAVKDMHAIVLELQGEKIKFERISLQ